MGIFNGIEILFFILGALTTLAVLGIIKLNEKYKLDWKTWTTTGLGAFLCLFCIAWSVSSVLEGEPQAASVGMVVFGLPSLISFALTRKLIINKKVK